MDRGKPGESFVHPKKASKLFGIQSRLMSHWSLLLRVIGK